MLRLRGRNSLFPVTFLMKEARGSKPCRSLCIQGRIEGCGSGLRREGPFVEFVFQSQVSGEFAVDFVVQWLR